MTETEHGGRAIQSVAALAARIATIPFHQRAYFALAARGACLPAESRAATLWLTTGIGASEAPARLFAGLLAERGHVARYLPLSMFLDGPAAPLGARRVVFSQGLSPNARLAFRERHDVARTLLVSSLPASHDGEEGDFLRALLAEGLTLLTIPPPEERGSLVRVVGPAVAMLAALDLAGEIVGDREFVKSLDQIPAATEQAFAAGQRLAERLPLAELGHAPLALISVRQSGERAHGLRWKLLEGLGHMDPPVWDVLQVAHGPFQHFYHRRLVLLALAAVDDPLCARLRQLCHPDRHLVVSLPAQLPPPLDVFEHDAALNAILLGALAASPRDLAAWPAQGLDGPLYELGR